MEVNENCCGEAEVTVAEVFLKIAYGAIGSSASEPGLNKGFCFHSSELRPLPSPKRLKSWSPKDVVFRNESIWAKLMEGVAIPDVRVENVNEVLLVWGV